MTFSQADSLKIIVARLNQFGLHRDSIIAICCNCYAESSLDPTSVSFDGGRGLFQWTGNWQSEAVIPYLNYTDEAYTFQINLLLDNPGQWISPSPWADPVYGTIVMSWEEFLYNKQNKDPRMLAQAFMRCWERPNDFMMRYDVYFNVLNDLIDGDWGNNTASPSKPGGGGGDGEESKCKGKGSSNTNGNTNNGGNTTDMELILNPFKEGIIVNQASFEDYSHGKSAAWDVGYGEVIAPIYAPFSGTVYEGVVQSYFGQKSLISDNKVLWGDGVQAYAAFVCTHDFNPPANGTKFKQGDVWYHTGGANGTSTPYSAHVHAQFCRISAHDPALVAYGGSSGSIDALIIGDLPGKVDPNGEGNVAKWWGSAQAAQEAGCIPITLAVNWTKADLTTFVAQLGAAISLDMFTVSSRKPGDNPANESDNDEKDPPPQDECEENMTDEELAAFLLMIQDASRKPTDYGNINQILGY